MLDGSGGRRKVGTLLVVNVGPPVVTNGILCVRDGDVALPKLLWDFLLVCICFYYVWPGSIYVTVLTVTELLAPCCTMC